MMRLEAGAVLAAVVMAACTTSSTQPPTDTCSGATITLSPLEVQTVAAANAPCVSMPADGGTYIVTPQFATGVGSQSQVGYEIGSGPPAGADVMPMVANSGHGAQFSLAPKPHGLRQQFDFMLRDRERQLARARAHRAAPAVAACCTPPIVGSTRIFDVLADLTGTTFKKDTAQAKYVGNNIAIYVSQDAPSGGLSAGDITALGNTFDLDLFPIDVNAFGAQSDIDANGRVIVLMSPKVNGITPAGQCSTLGYIAGFFDGLDLEPAQAHSNGGEVFFSIVPDPAGTFSCVHTVASVKATVLATFIHEFQHMISFNQHVLVRAGNEEDTWLNEGLSHIAEELGSLYYENKYPAPLMRTDPTQLFPDSSEGFIGGDLENSYSYLEDPGASSVTLFASGGTLEERGAAWIFLRWLADLKGAAIFGQLDQTALTGVTNVQTQAGESFPGLFGDFSMAIYSDSLPGFPRASAPARDRFVSRNLRLIYNRLFTTSGGSLPRPFPVLASAVPIAGTTTSSMIAGTMEYWKVTMPSSGSEMRLHFAAQGGGSFTAGLNAQLTVLRCPSAAACP